MIVSEIRFYDLNRTKVHYIISGLLLALGHVAEKFKLKALMANEKSYEILLVELCLQKIIQLK